MKKFFYSICVGLAFLLLCPAGCLADTRADFVIRDGKAIFRIHDMQADAEAYKLLLFAKTEYQGEDAWVYVQSKQYDAETLASTYVNQKNNIDNILSVKRAALKLFEKRDGSWNDCFGLCKSSMGSSDAAYDVIIGETEEKESEKQKRPKENLYILMEEDRTILPLELAGELYGFEARAEGETLTVNEEEGRFLEDSVFFAVKKKDREGLSLTKTSVVIAVETEPESEIETETSKETDSENAPQKQSGTETESQKESIGSASGNQSGTETETESETESKAETETESQKESIGSASGNQSGMETETESGTESKAETETEIETESQKESISSASGNQSGAQIAAETGTARETKTGNKTSRETETESATMPETETETETGSESRETGAEDSTEGQPGTETETESGTIPETEGQKTDVGGLAEKQSETETETESETMSETESQKTGAEDLMEKQSETQTKTESETERETGSEHEAGTEAETEGKRQGGAEKVILALAVIILIAIVVFLLVKRGKKQSEVRISPEVDDEDTVNLDEITPTAKKRTVPQKNSAQKYSIQGAVVNNKGLVRGNNEDNFYFNGAYMQREKMDSGALISGTSREPVQLYAVCDGMGGADSGEEASHRAVQELAFRRDTHERMSDPKELTAVLRIISEKINREAAQRSQKSGTTIVMALVKDGEIVFANVGDSRIYCLRDQKLAQMSMDHSKVQRMISMGLLTPEQAKTDPNRHVITQYLGMPADIKVSPYIVEHAELKKEDIYVLCSDGLTDMVDDSEIEAILKQKEKPQDAVQELLKAALNHGGRDNVTIMVLRVL